eukprot:TRINITY_DN1528_c0_g2_i1.p1 TRINITY_DN1528_c0_g2~~TRINITY_DN1528_c0_g2_i1.p1  ORF type:complete len:513 (-),score=138.97 TRINITY_DN1528_c0_g2_i1:1069-2607(-)
MEKLVSYIKNFKDRTAGVADPFSEVPVKLVPSRRLPSVRITDTSLGLSVKEVEELANNIYPEFTPEEEEEVRKCLGITPSAGADTKTLIISTVTRISRSRNNTCMGEPPAPKADEEEANEDENDFSTFRLSNVGSDDDDDDEKGNSAKNSKRGLKSLSAIANATNFETEEWEKRIMAIERGEWLEGMEENGWRRWKKDRPKLRESMFQPDAEPSPAKSAPSSSSSATPPTTAPAAAPAGTVTPASNRSSGVIDAVQPIVDSNSISVKIPFAELRTEDGEEFYTSFVLFVQYGKDSWSLCKRYSEFRVLLDDMYESFQTLCRQDLFPPKRMMGNFEDKFIEERRVQLEAWLSSVLLLATPELLKSEEVLHFLAATPNDFAMRKKATQMKLSFDLSLYLEDRVHKPTLPAAVIFKKLVNRAKIKVAEFNMPLNFVKNWELDNSDLNSVFFVEVYQWDNDMKRTTKYLGGSDFTLNGFATSTTLSVKIHLASPLDRGWWGYLSSGFINVEKSTLG